MLDKAKKAVGDFKEDRHKKKMQKAYERKQRELEEERQEAERIKKEQEAIEAEYKRLSSLDDKHLMVELICAVRGFYVEYASLKEMYQDLSERIDDIEEDIDEIRNELNSYGSDEEW